MITSWLNHFDKNDVPVIGVALEGSTEADDQAAELSITQLPGQPVELDEDGDAYFGSDGMMAALMAAIENEFLPRTKVVKQAEFNIELSPQEG